MNTEKPTSFPIISKYYWIYFVVSLCCLIPGIIALTLWGLRPGIDFSGGTLIQFHSSTTVTRESVRPLLSWHGESYILEPIGNSEYQLRLSELSEDERKKLIASLSGGLADYIERSYTSIGPSIGQELVAKTAVAVLIAAIAIACYLAIRFHSIEYGITAVIATLHDVAILLGSFSLFGHFLLVDVDALFVTALLTIVSFSVHDTVIVYDRIRERKKRLGPKESVEQSLDTAVMETLTRSVKNAMASVIVLVALILLGGENLRWFAVALLIGTISGTYSSTFVAIPLLVVIQKLRATVSKKGITK